MTSLSPLASQPDAAVEAVLDAAFGAGRHGRTAYRVREGVAWLPQLSFAAVEADGTLSGTLQSWPVALTDARGHEHPLVMVGPVAVLPGRQGAGLGRALMDRVVASARALGSDPLMMIGDPDYYGRFWGFSAEGTSGWTLPGPVERHRLLMLPIGDRRVPPDGRLGPRRALRQTG